MNNRCHMAAHIALSAHAMQLARQGDIPKVYYRPLFDVTGRINLYSRPAVSVEEAQTIFALMLFDSALADAGDLLGLQQ